MEWRDDRATRTVYSTDNSIYQVMPQRVALPRNADEIAAMLRTNAQAPKPAAIVARGGGTGTNGQSLSSEIMVDLKRHMNALISLDVENRTAVVQPGIVTGRLNALVAEHGLYWPPHTSTLNRATVGGMVSTDAAGKGSLVHGRAHRHVEQVKMLLADGTEFVAEPTPIAEAEHRAAGNGPDASLWGALLELAGELRDREPTSLGLPELARGFSGYGIDRLVGEGMIDPVALICGAEGTLGIVTEVTLRLHPLPTSTRLVVAAYPSFGAALDDAVQLRATSPAAIECFDETTLERGRSSPAWPALGSAVGDHEGAVLLLEYSDEASGSADAAVEALERSGRAVMRAVIDDRTAQASIWKVRADAVGLLAKMTVGEPELSARPTAFVEDCAVPVANMTAFIADFRRTLDDAGLRYGMFGHADVGCVHVRPALDLTHPDHRTQVAHVTERVIELVRRHGGLVWGEHGRGFRGAHVDQVLPAATLDLMRRVKTAFDPNDRCNPGKLYRPLGSNEPLLDVADPPMRGAVDGEVPVQVRRTFAHAFACNGNGLCHQHDASAAMCPSYKATGDPALSPRGRADLLRAWLHDAGDDADFADDIAQNLHQCLSCSACTGHCPVEVDIPELKSRFLHEYHRDRRRPLAHAVLGRFEQLAAVAGRAPALAGLGLRPAERLLGLVDLPAPPGRPKRRLTRFDDEGARDVDVVLLPDVFSSILQPSLSHITTDVLVGLGYRVATADFVPSGKFDHVKGRRPRFEAAVAAQRRLVERVLAAGAVPTVIEPAVALLHRHEYTVVDPGHPGSEVRPLVDLLTDRSDRLPQLVMDEAPRRVRVLGHCTERTTSPRTAQAWVTILQAFGHEVEAPPVGCCGMAGIFGHEAANQDLSRRLWEIGWAEHLSEARAESIEIVVPGYSCRSQAKRFAGAELRHPIELLAPHRSPSTTRT